MTIRLTDERVRWLVEQPDVATTTTTIESLAREVQHARQVIPDLETELAMANSEIERLRAVEAKLRAALELASDGLRSYPLHAFRTPNAQALRAKAIDAVTEAIRLLDGGS